MEQIIFIQTSGKKKGLWQLPLSKTYITKYDDEGQSLGHRKIAYAPGFASMFIEDLPKDVETESIWFNNGQLTVAANDKLKLEILTSHPWKNKHYKVFDKNSEDKEKLEGLKLKSKVGRLIDEADKDKIRAIALAIFGTSAFRWGEDTCELELLRYADEKPLELKRELDHDNYESKYLSALAFSKEIVKYNPGKTLVQWNDTTEGVLLRLSKGEQGVAKLGEYLATRTDESESVLQEIGSRIEKIEINLPQKPISEELIEEKSKIDSEREKFEQEKARFEEEKARFEEEKKKTGVNQEDKLSLEDATKLYKEILGKDVSNNKKNDLDWILEKNKRS